MSINPKLLEDLSARRKTAELAGGKDKLEKRKAKGQLSARERLQALFDNGEFQEFGQHAAHTCHRFGLKDKKLPGDGVVCGAGFVDGRPVAAFSQDFTVGGGALGRIHSKKICDLMDYAHDTGIPVVSVNDSGGARIQEGVDSLSGYGQVFYKNVFLSGVVPQVAIIAGPCAGGAAYSPALADFIIMTQKNANMFICGPGVIKAATGENASLEQFATASAHASVAGNIHIVADDDKHAIELSAELLSYLPSNNISDPPHHLDAEWEIPHDPRMNEAVPDTNKMPLDTHEVISYLVDDEHFFEIMRDFAPNLITGFARIGGIVVGIIGNNPKVKAGTLDIDSSDKGARFIRTCNIYNIPIVNLVDVPGFMPGLAQERGGIIRHGAKMLFAYASATVPKITLIMRKAYGGAYLAMCSSDMGADVVYAWPTAEIAVMGAEGAVGVLFKKEIAEAEDPAKRTAELVEEYHDEFASPYQAAANAMITDVIEPAETRSKIAQALRLTLSKRDTRPPKKHGNIPL
ncbi:acyl-CoA carboxylase subunit beta [Pelagicoccus sp. NFK12]|uniref:Acyl-CoA carboxylase subunit beta n=1 Tax=Pelagicoccus enzymogenes TaxID=2773457 RepID=A0A927FAN1_9BACT|nr:acyl-CoA carboxylase subunit beta [Pelagicoccus enzymogenes]MBD5780291.1 acyl-CoA carboxylase subunit beta [Pelagicoccus enzymogenes]MDQ8197806.1 acyl-CoA carboxylase subunit beta [Pelagicoccus enzymogenes]